MFQVIEQLAEILKSGNLPEVKQWVIMTIVFVRIISTTFYRSQAEICRECYNVFQKYLEGDSRKNENYLARFIEFFQKQVSIYL